MRSIVIGSAIMALGVITLLGGTQEASDAGAAASSAPTFELITSVGEAVSNASVKGKPTLLVFWAPWCKVCQKELPELAAFHQREKPAHLRMVSIGFADLRSNVEAFVDAHRELFVFPTAFDEDRWVAQAFKVTVTPTYVALDSEGRIALIHRGGGILHNWQFHEFLAASKG